MFGKPESQLEDEFRDKYDAWKADPTPVANATFLQHLSPVIEGAIQTHVGPSNPILFSKARLMTMEGLRKYDPLRGKLKTHLYNHLQGLKRFSREQTLGVKAPERVQLEKYNMDSTIEEMNNELGREPTDAELMDRLGINAKRLTRIRQFSPGVAQGMLTNPETGEEIDAPVMSMKTNQSIWMDLVHSELDPHLQKVLEMTVGMNGQRKHSNNEIAKKLGKSPAAISQAKARIQALLDKEQEYSPFLGE